MNKLTVNLSRSLLLFVLLIIGGTLGYHVFTGESFSKTLYMTIISITTVGYGEIIDMSNNPGGRIFTIVLLLSGMGVTVYFSSNLTAFLVEGELKNILWRRSMQKKIDQLSQHIILVGGGQTAFYIVQELLDCEHPFIVIERDLETFKKLKTHYQQHYQNPEVIGIIGDATEDDILLSAGIERALGMIITLPDDRDNLYVTATAHGLNPRLRIVCKVVREDAGPKVLRSGANQVVCSDSIGGLRMVSEMLRPHVVSFLDNMLRDTAKHMRIGELLLLGEYLVGQKVEDIDIDRYGSMLLLALKRFGEKEYTYNPPPHTILQRNDTLIVMGDTHWLREAQKDFEK